MWQGYQRWLQHAVWNRDILLQAVTALTAAQQPPDSHASPKFCCHEVQQQQTAADCC
jgi:hypothetical protein